MTRLHSHLTQGHFVHSEISPAPQALSPSLESIIPKSIATICIQHFCRFSLRLCTPGISRRSFCSLCTPNSSTFSRALARLNPLLFKGTASSVIPRTPIKSASLKFANFAQFFPSSLATIDIRSVPSRTPPALRVQPRAYMHTPCTSRATLVLHAQPSLEAKQVSTNAMYPLAGPVGQ